MLEITASATPSPSPTRVSAVSASPTYAILSNSVDTATTWKVQAMAKQPSFASRLRWWRDHKGLSQLELAGRAEISQRHLSFLELDRAAPSREMVMRLAEA